MTAKTVVQGPYNPRVRHVTGDGCDIACIDVLGDPAQVVLIVNAPGDCDALIKAAVEAKDLLLAAQEPAPEWVACGAMFRTDESTAGFFLCTRPAGHDGDHEADGTRAVDEPPLTWPREPAPLPGGAS